MTRRRNNAEPPRVETITSQARTDGISSITRYVVTLPDGGKVTRDSARRYTHAVVTAERNGSPWGVLALAETRELAGRRAATYRKLWPSEPCLVVAVMTTVPLTDRQAALLAALGNGPREVFGASEYAQLAKRGLVERRFIGMRWWQIRRTPAGKAALQGHAAADPASPSQKSREA